MYNHRVDIIMRYAHPFFKGCWDDRVTHIAYVDSDMVVVCFISNSFSSGLCISGLCPVCEHVELFFIIILQQWWSGRNHNRIEHKWKKLLFG